VIGLIGSPLRPAPGRDRDPAQPREQAMAPPLTKLTEHLLVYRGPINVGIVRDGPKALLIDCGDGRVAGALGSVGVTSVDQVVFTHHHRDQACGAGQLAAGGARLGVPAAERDHFEKVTRYWENPGSRWHLYNLHPHHLMLAEPVPVDAAFKGGQVFRWGPATIRVVATPGHTDGSVSYVVDVDGKRTAFCGDAIYDTGRVWDIHSLQKGVKTTDYHGFLGAREQLVKSLARLKARKPAHLVPSHGRIMTDPPKAIDALVERLEVCYDRYVAISALRHYFPKLFTTYAGRKGHMPIRKGKPVPRCLRHFGTTWMLVSKDQAAFVMDCGGGHVVKEIQKRLAAGKIRGVEGLWVTHYHDDHVDGIPAFQKAFDCPCITDRSVADVITQPLAWRLPCISPHVARVDRTAKDGESWRWREFKMTAYHFPGQTLYHAGLLVERGEMRMFFAGDSFTMSGIDDYCSPNRNFLGRGVGFDRCLALMEKLRPTHIFNPHVGVAFDFTPEQCRFMRDNLAEREKLYTRLVGWDHANFGMDEPWVRCHPYEQKVAAGKKAAFDVVVTNHAAGPRRTEARAVLPHVWDHAFSRRRRDVAAKPNPVTDWVKAGIAAKREGRMRLSLRVPADAKRGRYVIPVDLHFGRRLLPQFTEAVLVV